MEDLGIQIKDEADASELRAVLAAFANQEEGNTLTEQAIKKVFELLPKSIGYWLKNSPPLENDDYRGEMSNGVIVRAIPREGYSGAAFGHPYEVDDYLEVHIKFEGKAKDAIAEQLGWNVRNG